ncbi:MAG: response regulator [bacterium]
MEKPSILIIDDDKAICDACFQVLTQEQYSVEVSQDGVSGLERIDDFKPDVVFIDLMMPGLSGAEILPRVREKDPFIMPIVITGFATIDRAVESMKLGAYDFLPKPFTPEQLRIITRRALDRRCAAMETARLHHEKERMRQNFISMVSHELRTPLVAVMQYLEVILSGSAGNVADAQLKIVERMNVRVTELLKIIDRWLKLARIEDIHLKDEFVEFDLSAVIRESIDVVREATGKKNVAVVFESGVANSTVCGDREMLKEVFTNLIGNGIKYNREGGSVSLSLYEKPDTLVLDVSDTGVGISEADIPRLGEEFYRIKRDATAPGIGIGLAIVKKILDIHGGELEIESKLDKGSKFSVYLPKRKTKGAA